MGQIDYAAMSDKELRQYFLRHQADETALQAYLERLGERLRQQITIVDNPDFETKLEAATLQQMQAEKNNDEASV